MKRCNVIRMMMLCTCLSLLLSPFNSNTAAGKKAAPLFNNFTVAVKPGYSAPPGQFLVKVKNISTGAVVYESPVFGEPAGEDLPFGTTIPAGEYAVEVMSMYIIKASSNGQERTVMGSETWIAAGGATPISILVWPN